MSYKKKSKIVQSFKKHSACRDKNKDHYYCNFHNSVETSINQTSDAKQRVHPKPQMPESIDAWHINTIQYILNWPLPIGAFQGQWNNQRNNRTQQQQLLRIPTGRRQSSWLFTSAAGKLNQGLPLNKFSEWSERVLNPGSPDLKASALTTGPHCLLARPMSTFVFHSTLDADRKQWNLYIIF